MTRKSTKQQSTKHSQAWWEGYNCQLPKTHNPYAVGQPWLAEHPDEAILQKMKDWDNGWQTRYYGEEP